MGCVSFVKACTAGVLSNSSVSLFITPDRLLGVKNTRKKIQESFVLTSQAWTLFIENSYAYAFTYVRGSKEITPISIITVALT